MSDYLKKRFEHMLAGKPLPEKKKPKPISKKSPKRIAKEAEQKEALGGEPTEKELWFQERRKEMTGRCWHCGGKSCKDSDEFFRHSCCHILPKAYFPSIALHEFNFIELCFWKNNCHGNMDNKTLDLIDMNCWNTIVERFLIMYPAIDKKEHRRIPAVLMQYVNTET